MKCIRCQREVGGELNIQHICRLCSMTMQNEYRPSNSGAASEAKKLKAELECHRAFAHLATKERDAARAEVERLTKELAGERKRRENVQHDHARLVKELALLQARLINLRLTPSPDL